MKKMIVKMSMVILLVVTMVGMQNVDVSAKIKTKKITLNLRGGGTSLRQPKLVRKAKKVKVKSSKKSVVKVKYLKKKKQIYLQGRKKGTAVVRVTCRMKNGKTKKLKYKVKVIRTKAVTDLERSKKAFAIQNQYRKDEGVKELEWSEELYQFALYRLKTSGYDKHRNLGRDMNNYFGDYVGYKDLIFSENLVTGATANDAMKSWKKSGGHYRNLMDEDHVCGAIAYYKGMWIAIFYDKSIDDFANWRSYQVKKVVLKRYDNAKGEYVTGSNIAYYEEGKREETFKVNTISSVEGKNIYLEIGKTYVFYERIAPDGCAKAKSITFTVTPDGNDVVSLSN